MNDAMLIERPEAPEPAAAPARPPARRVAARLAFRRAGAKTILAAQRSPHPFHITRPFHLEGDPRGMATLYLQSSSGGLYGDDDLSLEICVAEGAAAHVTTQASTVTHDARGGETRQRVDLSVAAGGLLEYCPDPQILFAGARLRAEIVARAAPGAWLLIADAALVHDPAGRGRPFDRFVNEIRIETSEGALLLIDRARIEGADWAARTAGRPCCGALIAVAPGPEEAAGLAERLAAALAEIERADGVGRVYGGVSPLPERGVALARFLAADGAALSTAQEALRRAARIAMTGAPPARRPK